MKYLGEAGFEHIKERTYDAYSGKPCPWRRFGGKRQKWVKVHTLALLTMINELEEIIAQRDDLLAALERMIKVYEAYFKPLPDDQQPKGTYTQARAALAAARGGEAGDG